MTILYNSIGNFKDVQAFTIELNHWLAYDKEERQDTAVIALNGEAYCVLINLDGNIELYSADNRSVFAFFTYAGGPFNNKWEFALPVVQILFEQGLLSSMGTIGIDTLEIFSGTQGLNHILWQELLAGTREHYELAKSYQDELFTNERGG